MDSNSKRQRKGREDGPDQDLSASSNGNETQAYEEENNNNNNNQIDDGMDEMLQQKQILLEQKEQLTLLIKQDPANVQLQAMWNQVHAALDLLQDVREARQNRCIGIVEWYNIKKGFGVITVEKDKTEIPDGAVFCHKSQIQCSAGTPCLSPNTRVSFFLSKSEDGRYCADQVTDVEGNELPSLEALESLDIVHSVDSRIGKKETQEDRYVQGVRMGGELGIYFGIFDGHGGASCAEYVARHLHKNIASQLEQYKDMGSRGFKKAITEGFKQTDTAFLQKAIRQKQLVEQGSTGLCMFLTGKHCPSATEAGDVVVHIANLGDCRAVMCRNGDALRLTDDHKPNRPDEKSRILAAGGCVFKYGSVYRVTSATGEKILNGTVALRPGAALPRALAVSRSFGDSDLKNAGDKGAALVSSDAEYAAINVTAQDAFIVMACDGIWDVLTDQEVVEIVKPLFGDKSSTAANAVVQAALDKGSEDNVTAIVIQFNWIVSQNRLAELTLANVAAAAGETLAKNGDHEEIDDLYGN